jgi:hypothetical protein
MSKWFQPLPDDLSDLVGASKFQHETMARLVRFYKGKCLGQKELIERLRREVDTLKVSWHSQFPLFLLLPKLTQPGRSKPNETRGAIRGWLR